MLAHLKIHIQPVFQSVGQWFIISDLISELYNLVLFRCASISWIGYESGGLIFPWDIWLWYYYLTTLHLSTLQLYNLITLQPYNLTTLQPYNIQTKRQKDKKTKGQKDKRTKRQKDKRTKRQKDKRTKRQKDKKTKQTNIPQNLQPWDMWS